VKYEVRLLNNESIFKKSVALMRLLYLHFVLCESLSIRSYIMLAVNLADLKASLEVIFESALSNSAAFFVCLS
jgi:hypothetical protein